MPLAAAAQLGPQGGKKGAVLAARAQQVRLLPDHFFLGIAGDEGKRRVGVNDDAVGVGDHDALAGEGEHVGRQLQALLGLFALGDVTHDADVVAHLAVVVKHLRDGHRIPKSLAIFAVVEHFTVKSAPRLLRLANGVYGVCVGAGALQKFARLAQNIFQAIAGDVREGAVHRDHFCVRIGDHHALRNRHQGLIVDLQLALGGQALGDVVDDREQHGFLVGVHRRRIHLDIAHFARAQSVLKDEGVAVFMLGQGHLHLGFFGR